MMTRTCLAILLFAISSFAQAQVWTEVGDAPHVLTGQLTMGIGPLLRIDGSLTSADFDPDLYCIQITDPGNFSATTVGSGLVDLSLWLFDANGNGVTHDGADDFNGGPNAGYQASLSNVFITSPGIYFLGVSRGGIDALSGTNEIWQDMPTIESQPNGPGAAGQLTDWSTPGYGFDNSQYAVQLTGASYHGVPEPSGPVLVFMGIGFCCAMRIRHVLSVEESKQRMCLFTVH